MKEHGGNPIITAIDEQLQSQFPDPPANASGDPAKEFFKRPRPRTETIFLRMLKEIEEMEQNRDTSPTCRRGKGKKRRRRRGPRVLVFNKI
jgi:hypothetical protein